MTGYGTAAAMASLIALAAPVAARAQDAAPLPADQRIAIHGQATFVGQATPGFRDPYDGPNSLTPDQAKETVDVTAYVGASPWHGAELWANPEIDQGFGLSNTLGAAGFPSAEAYKVGKSAPYLRLQRLFFRQTIDLGGAREAVASVANQLGGSRTSDRIVLTLGKFSVGDVFDTNALAHDPRADFLNWSAVDAGSFDYAADAWGYSYGVAAEWYRGAWTWRLGAFDLSKVPNGETLETGFGQYQIDAEVEHRHTLNGRPGAVRLTLWRNRGRFSSFADALALAAATGEAPDPSLTRRPRTRVGASVNGEQAVSDTLGLFARAGIADGSIEPYDFTDIDRTVQAGGVLAGKGWGRPGDRIGLAAIVNGISAEHRRYLAAGGLGVLVGDGQLPHPGAEAIGEGWYAVGLGTHATVTLDYQLIVDPGYNRDRGPVSVVALRAHYGI
ncbi:carbohydrate porin [uncultured Sphingomonas sp.]|uniref:carbohydrate porin n=1 Tax=uncultured Sphingomonas sp. TaxID=158754 RepID=UPI0035C9A4BA